MDPISLGLGAASIYSGISGRGAASKAAEQQLAEARAAREQQQRQWEYTQNQMSPWVQAGRGALTEQQALMGLGGDTEGATRALIGSPEYMYGQQQGERALAGSSAARGGMGSGKAMQAAYQGGVNYLSGQRQNRLANLASLSGQGYGAASGLGQLGSQYATNMGNIGMQMGNIGAASTLARSDINKSMLGDLAGLGIQGYQSWQKQNQPSVERNYGTGIPEQDWYKMRD